MPVAHNIFVYVCIATITPEDGRVVDGTSWSLAPDGGCSGWEGFNDELLAPLGITKPAFISIPHLPLNHSTFYAL